MSGGGVTGHLLGAGSEEQTAAGGAPEAGGEEDAPKCKKCINLEV